MLLISRSYEERRVGKSVELVKYDELSHLLRRPDRIEEHSSADHISFSCDDDDDDLIIIMWRKIYIIRKNHIVKKRRKKRWKFSAFPLDAHWGCLRNTFIAIDIFELLTIIPTILEIFMLNYSIEKLSIKNLSPPVSFSFQFVSCILQ